MKVDETVRRETGYIALGVAVLSVAMEAVYVLIGRWDYTVLCGNLLGAAAAVLNFFLMGLTVQKAVLLEEKDAAAYIRASQMLRNLMVALFLVAAAAIPCFSLISAAIPLFFPRIVILIRGFTIRDEAPAAGKEEKE